jgi:hypothetical protein
MPVRIVVFVLVVPVRMVWDALVAGGRLLHRAVLRPLGRGLAWAGQAVFVWPWVALWRYVLVPVGAGLAWVLRGVGAGLGWLGRVLLVVPAVWLYRRVLAPAGRGLALVVYGIGAGVGRVLRRVGAGFAWALRGVGAGLAWVYARVLTPCGRAVVWLVRWLVVVPGRWLYRYVLIPVGRGVVQVVRGVLWLVRTGAAGVGFVLYWTVRLLLVLPALALWRWLLRPVGRALVVVGRELAAALGHAWRVAGRVSLAVGRFLRVLLRWTVAEPARWAYRRVLTPVGHLVRDAVLRPAAEAARGVGRVARQARADLRRALFGEPAKRREAVRREPGADAARTLERSTTALTKD